MTEPPGAATFYDGSTTKTHPVEVSVESAGLSVSNRDSGQTLFWPWTDLRIVERRASKTVLVVTSTEAPSARLVLHSQPQVDAIALNAPQLKHIDGFQRAKVVRMGVILGAGMVAVALFIAVPVLTLGLGRMIPAPWVRTMGAGLVEQIADGADWCNAARGQAVLDQMVADLSAAAPELPFALDVRVLDYPVANAFAAPGGYVVIFEGLIVEAQSAEEVAGVLAHEIAHVIHRHPTESLVRTLGLAALTEGLIGDGIGASAAFLLVATAYSRDAEAQADATAVALLEAAGYDPGALGDFFSRLAQEEEELGLGFIPGYLSTHPPSEERTQMVEALTRDTTVRNRTLTPRAFLELQGICG